MKLTKFPQSCALLESNSGTKILIDPGSIDFEEKFLNSWNKADAIFVTHKHSDHFNKEFLGNTSIKIYSTKEVQNCFADIKINDIKVGDKVVIGDMEIEVVKAIHGFLPKMKTGGEVLENVGYIVRADGTSIYITSDTICFNNDYKADFLFAPVTGHGIAMSAYETSFYTKMVGAKLLIVCHLDNTKLFPKNLEYLDAQMKEQGIEYVLLDYGQTIDLK